MTWILSVNHLGSRTPDPAPLKGFYRHLLAAAALERARRLEGTSEIQRQIVATYLKHGWTERPKAQLD